MDKSAATGDYDEALATSMVCDPDSSLLPVGFDRTRTDEIIVFINAGGDDPTVLDSRVNIVGDTCFIGGNKLRTDASIVEAGDYPFIYQSAREGNFSYELNKIVPGEYFIDLHFSQFSNTKRIFDVYVQERKVLAGLDIFALVGSLRPLMLVDLRVKPSADGDVTLKFKGISGDPVVSGICLRKESSVSVSDLLKEALLLNGGRKDLRNTQRCCRALKKISSLILPTRDLKRCINKLSPLLSDKTVNVVIKKSVGILIRELKEDLEADARFPTKLSTDETPSLFEMLRSICCQRHNGTITSHHWVRVTRVLCRLLEISALPSSDLSVGKKLSFTISFICESSEGKTKAAAKVLADNIERDYCKKKIRSAVLDVKGFASFVHQGVYMNWASKASVNASLSTLMEMPPERVRHSFVAERATISLQQLATYSTTKKPARKLLEKIFD